ncbi:MAG: hypothetical protein GY788_30550 [bacterium]|nr:hypothetical protein [bacterium]
MPNRTLNQNPVDATIAGADRNVEPFDFHGGKALDAEIVAEVEALHESFAEELADRLTNLLQVPVVVESAGIDQARFESYINALPNPTMLGIIDLSPGGYRAVTDLANHLGFSMLDILLGGSGRPAGFRAFTDLEAILLGEVIDHVGWSIRAAFEPLREFEPSVADIQSKPAIDHIAVASDSVLVQSFKVRIDADHRSEGILSVCYPGHLLDAILKTEAAPEVAEEPLISGDAPMSGSIKEAPVGLKARLTGAKLSLGDLGLLQPGDVVVLGIPTSAPATVSIGDVDLFEGDVGRHNGQIALRLNHWMAT